MDHVGRIASREYHCNIALAFTKPGRFAKESRLRNGRGTTGSRIDVCAYPVDAAAGDWVTIGGDRDDDDASYW